MNLLADVFDQISDLQPEKKMIEDNAKTVQEYQTAADEALDKLSGYVAEHTLGSTANSPMASSTGSTRSGTGDKPPNKLLLPKTLTKEDSPSKFPTWVRDFTTFLNSGTYQDNISQQAYFLRCIDDHLNRSVEPRMNAQRPIMGKDGCLDILRGEFKTLYPIFTRQVEYFQATQDQAEDSSSYLDKLASLALEADIKQLDMDAIMVFKFISSCKDQKLREKLFELKQKNMSEVRRIVNQHDSHLKAEEAIKDKTATIADVGPKPNQSHQSNRNSRYRSFIPRSLEDLKGRCYKCGQPRHADPKKECRVILENLSCHHCQGAGHLSTVCFKKLCPRLGTKAIRAFIEDVTTDDEVTPRLPVVVSHSKGKFSSTGFPDTGSATSMISTSFIRKHNIEVTKSDPHQSQKFVNINGDPVPTAGVAHLQISTPKAWISTTAVVSPVSTDGLLIGFRDLKRLGVVPPQFPIHNCNKLPNFDSIKQDLIKLYPSVLSDTLSESAMMRGSPMKIYTRDDEGIKPYKAMTARNVPLHWQDKADKLIQKMIDSKRMIPKRSPLTTLPLVGTFRKPLSQ